MKNLLSNVLFFLLLSFTHSSYCMNKIDEEMFQENFLKLNDPLKNFVQDFKIKGTPAATPKYGGSVSQWLSPLITTDQTIPFFLVLDYLKKQKME